MAKVGKIRGRGGYGGIDERDIGPRDSALTDYITGVDEKIEELKNKHAADVTAAGVAIQAGDLEKAATHYDAIAAAFRASTIAVEAKYWEDRARDCRREAKKGITRR